jgi:hypothetical protein
MLPFDHFEPADTATDVYAHLLVIFGRDAQAGVAQGAIRRCNRELNKAPHFFDFFFLDILRRIEALHLSGNPAGKGGRIKLRDGAYARAGHAQPLPGHFGPHAERRQQADARNYDSSRQNKLPGNKKGSYFLLETRF